MPHRMLGTFFKLVGKAMRFAIHRPIQRFNIFNRVKKHLGEEAKYFMPAPRAIGSQSLRGGKPLQYPHLETSYGFKSIRQRREAAIAERNQRLLSAATTGTSPGQDDQHAKQKSFSETIDDDDLVISTSSKLPVIKTVISMKPPESSEEQPESSGEPTSEGQITPDGELVAQAKSKRPLPTSTNLQLSNPAVIWQVDKVPPGRLDLNKFQELMINKLGDDVYWTPAKIAETYNIKEEYAENLITYFKQIRIIVSPRMAKALDYVGRANPVYQATKHIVYHVDKSMRSELEKQYDDTFLPTDELPPEVRDLLDSNASVTPHESPLSSLAHLIKRPEPLRLRQTNEPERPEITDGAEPRHSEHAKRLAAPVNLNQPAPPRDNNSSEESQDSAR